MAEISQAMIGSLQEAMAQLTAAVSSLTSTASVILASKADKSELEQKIGVLQTTIDQKNIELNSTINQKITDIRTELAKGDIINVPEKI
jgi:molybdopterin converting factor small subunit